MPNVPDILWFKDITDQDLGKVGGKGKNLGIMANAHFPIPPGFVVTAQAYFHWIEQAGIKFKIIELADSIDVENTSELEKTTAQIRELILNAKMTDELSIEIKTAYNKVNERQIAWLSSREKEFVAVRSSATAEDLPEASFAGQQETFLNVRGDEEVVEAVKKCWASLFTARATYYRKKHGFPTEKVGIAVVVQKMVNSDAAGVMFTADPTGDRSKIIIEAAFGLGEAVVSGSLTPDHYEIDKASLKILRKKIAEQAWRIVRATKGNLKEEVPLKIRGEQKVSDAVIIELAKIGKQIESHYAGAPQDIEWAVEKGKVYIVQSRAITTLGMEKKVSEEKSREAKVAAIPIVRGLPASPGASSARAKVVPEIEDIEKVKEGDILVTKMTSPDWVPIMRKSAAIVTNEGGLTCHAAIVSRELGIPCVVGTENATEKIKDSELVTVDGYNGYVFHGKIEIIAPVSKEDKAEVVEKAELDELEEAVEEEEEELTDGAKEEAVEIVKEFKGKKATEMQEGEVLKEEELLVDLLKRVAPKVKVNVALPEAADDAAATGAEGVGLLRAEHMITASGEHPAEFERRGEQEKLVQVIKDGIRNVASRFPGKPVWYRTFDARTDEFRHLKGGEKEPKEDNPMLGWHGIRRDLDEPELLRAQFKAVKELRAEGMKNVGIMLPFVTNIEEVRKAKEICRETGLEPCKEVDFGVMVETPAAVWIIEDMIAEGINFISFGTNDLTQTTLGIDRNNERIQKWFSELHPAVLKELEFVINACKKAGVTTSICGQAGSNPEMVKRLVRMGIDSVSANIDAVKKIQKVVLLEEKKLILEKRHKLV